MLFRAGSHTLKISTSQTTKLTGESASATHTTTFLSVTYQRGFLLLTNLGGFLMDVLHQGVPNPPRPRGLSAAS